MKPGQYLTRFASLAVMVLIAGCGGSSGNFAPLPPPPPPPPTALSAVGIITALGSATINGVVYNTDTATVSSNGVAGTAGDLKLGQLVSLEGTIESDGSSGTANAIEYNATCIGPVESIDAATGQLVVMGQTVLTNAETVFDSAIDPVTLTGITVGENAQVSGLFDTDGNIVASRVEPDPTSTRLQLFGAVSAVDLANLLFRINRLTVDYSNATLIDLPGGMPGEGQLVYVIGTLSNGVFNVDQIESVFDDAGAPGSHVQATGIINSFESATDFEVFGFPVTTNASTAFINGTSADLLANIQVLIDGVVSADGASLVASSISIGGAIGDTATLTFDLTDFTEVAIFDVFNVSIAQSDTFLVEVTIDQDFSSNVNVTQVGNRVNFRLENLPAETNIQTLEVVVSLPVLNLVRFDGVINGSVSGFNQSHLNASVNGVSVLRGSAMMFESLAANVSGVSQLDLGAISPLSLAQIDISGVSSATLNMDIGASLNGIVTGVSSLLYFGSNVDLNVTIGTGSSVTRLGETRP